MPRVNPNLYREFPEAGVAYVADNAVFETYDHGTFLVKKGLQEALAAGSSAALDKLVQFAQGMSKLSTSSQIQVTQIHHQIGRMMQEATVAAYKQALAASPRAGLSPYRLSTRDAGGRLLRALESPLFFRAGPDGIGFVNTTLLDNEAKQWHRLNFGAGGKGGARTGSYQARFEGIVIGSFGFTDESSSAGFVLPKGLWTEPGGGARQAAGQGIGEFYPASERYLLSGKGIKGRNDKLRPTAGIAAWNFLDAGVRVLAQELGPAYERLYTGWEQSALRGVGPLKTTIKLPTPAGPAFT